MVLKVLYKSILHCSVHMVTASIIYIVLPFGSIITIKVYQLTLAKSIFWLCNVKMDITYSKSNIVRINKTVEYCAIQTSTECAGRIISMQLIVKIHTTHVSIVALDNRHTLYLNNCAVMLFMIYHHHYQSFLPPVWL